jgi:regulator of extracellular matrix RemA (YlzA/DUF370 family)
MPTHVVYGGLGTILAMTRVVALVAPHAAPVRCLIHEGTEQGTVLDRTRGRRTRAVLVMDDRHSALVARTAETLLSRLRTVPPGDPGSESGEGD